ncbi:MAG TPA: carboxy terminal-processing peptidase [Chitinophagales bacterium]|nr:carboxy terminal-processing peptidase [Chitinophagales bacterium]
MSKYSFAVKPVVVTVAIATLAISVVCFSFACLKLPAGDKKELIGLVMGGINAVHYAPQPVDDAFSEKIFKEFIERVDYNKKIFTQKDIDQLKSYKKSIDDQLKDSSYAFFDAVMKIYTQRIEQAYRYSTAPLGKAFDFTADESMETDGDKLSFVADTIALKEEWRKYMKLQVLQQLNLAETQQQKAREKSDTVKIKSFEEMETAAREKVKKNNEDFFDRVRELENNDWLAIYINTISNIEDPHTEYFPPVQKQNFDIQITGQLEGIGAQLQQRDGDIRVTNIVAGSASWRQGQLKANDVILSVGQGAAEPVSIEGMRLDKAIQLIRGKKGTEVRLTVRKPDGSVLIIPIIRDIVVLEATYAQSLIINAGDKKIGYIRLPEFYAAFDQKNGRSSADDVRKELEKLKAENVSGVILDLRDNGGGSLQEAVKMGGLFIPSGPIVQVRPRGSKPNVLADTEPSVVYSGPLTIMVNYYTASASEIIAAAMQDYHRAVIIGSNSTYGKGTVQNFFNLDDFVSQSDNSAPKLGSLKITIQKYYRINGGTTQLKGVTPDIIVPDPYAQIPYGEKEDPYALGWDEIAPAKYENWTATTFDLTKLRSHSQERVTSSNAFQLVQEEAADFKLRRANTVYSLNYKKFSAEQEALDIKEKKYDAITADTALVAVSNLAADWSKINFDTTSIARNQQFLKNLKKDIYLYEATQVVSEMK